MARCVHCGRGISRRASVCPHCGEPNPTKMKSGQKVFAWITVISLAVAAFTLYKGWYMIGGIFALVFLLSAFLRRKV